MSYRNMRVCPVEKAGLLDTRMRRLIQNPHKIVGPYISKGMLVLDVGCGPGFFAIEMAQMVGPAGHVIAADLQAGMLQKVRDKIQGTELEARITLHKCANDKIGVAEQVDFILLFYLVHEVPNVKEFFSEIATLLKPRGQILMVEPFWHVSKKAFANTIKEANDVSFTVVDRPKILLSKAVILEKR